MKKYRMGRYKKHTQLKIAVIFLVLASMSLTAFIFLHKHTASAPEKNSSQIGVSMPVVPKVTIKQVVGRYLFNGTIFWARGVEHWAQRVDGSFDYAHPFSGLDTFNRSAYDAWVADLECPITTRGISFQDQINLLAFNCLPEYTPEAAKYFNILDLANNHTDNRGPSGIPETRANLEKNNIQYFGHYDPALASDVCEIIALPVRIQKSDNREVKGAFPVAFCAWHYFYRLPLEGEIEGMKKYAEVMPVFAFVHMGAEYNTSAQQVQRDIAHKVADQGPEFVIANNPHWVQDSEVYKGKLIVYSTGNFIFDQYDSEGTRSASIDASVVIPYNNDTQAWLDLADQCKTFQDTCLQKIQDAHLKKPELKLTYDVVAGDNSGHLTKKGSDAMLEALKVRLKWAVTLKGLTP